jgi:uncharacterized protein (TIGR02246 family)
MQNAISALTVLGVAAGLALASPAVAADPPSQAQIVRDLHDRELILDLMARYGFALDAGDGAAYADLFTDDAVLIAGGGEEYRGREALIKLGESVGQLPAAAGGVQPGPKPPIHHLFSNVAMDIRGETATVKAYWEVVNGRTGTPVMQSMGRYEDALVKRGGQWRFTRRRIINETLALRPRPPAN